MNLSEVCQFISRTETSNQQSTLHVILYALAPVVIQTYKDALKMSLINVIALGDMGATSHIQLAHKTQFLTSNQRKWLIQRQVRSFVKPYHVISTYSGTLSWNCKFTTLTLVRLSSTLFLYGGLALHECYLETIRCLKNYESVTFLLCTIFRKPPNETYVAK